MSRHTLSEIGLTRTRPGQRRRMSPPCLGFEVLEARELMSGDLQIGTVVDLGVIGGAKTRHDFVASNRTNVYTVRLAATATLAVRMDGMAADANLAIFDGNVQYITGSNNSGTSAESISRTLSAGTYYVTVFRSGSGGTGYNLTLSAISPPDGAGNTVSAARDLGELNATKTLSDFVGTGDRNDYYRFKVSKPSNFTLRMDGLAADADVQLLNLSGATVATSTLGGTTPEAIDRVLEAGTYYVRVYPYGNVDTNYRLTMTSKATTVAGWSSATGFRGAETAVQRSVVANANAAVGGSSGASRVAPSGSAGAWLTDTADGDGAKMQKAIQAYDTWYVSQRGRGVPIAAVRATMLNKFNGSNYSSADKNALIDRMIQVYDGAVRTGKVSIPTNDQAALDFLGIRRQCLEWTASISSASGGKAKNYSAPSVTDPAKFRPGMGLLKTDKSHAMVIVDIEWDASGRAVRFKVAEANAANSRWGNPTGMIPWERTVQFRYVQADANVRVVDFAV